VALGDAASRLDAGEPRRLGPGGLFPRIDGERLLLVDEYLAMHQAEPVTIAKLRWLLGKATATLGGLRLAELSPKDVYAWRLTIPEGHRDPQVSPRILAALRGWPDGSMGVRPCVRSRESLQQVAGSTGEGGEGYKRMKKQVARATDQR
jgi:hypothetical protein